MSVEQRTPPLSNLVQGSKGIGPAGLGIKKKKNDLPLFYIISKTAEGEGEGGLAGVLYTPENQRENTLKIYRFESWASEVSL